MLTQQPTSLADYSESNRSEERVELTPAFTLDGRAYSFKTPVACTIAYEDGVLIDCESYRLYGHGETLQEAQSALFSAFGMLYAEYALEEESRLAPRAQRLKRELLGSVNDGDI